MILLCISICGYTQISPSAGAVKEDFKHNADTTVNEGKQEVKQSISSTKEELLQEASQMNRLDEVKKIQAPRVDSVGVAYENGKLVKPDQLPSGTNDLKILKPEDSGSLTKDNFKDKLPGEKILDPSDSQKKPDILLKKSTQYLKGTEKSDSLQQLVDKAEKNIEEIKEAIDEPQKIYSKKSLKRIYDSLGVSKLDTVLAMGLAKKEVTKEELLQAIDLSFPKTPMEKPINDPMDLTKTIDSPIGLENFNKPDLSKLKLPTEDLQQLQPIRGFQIPTDSFPLLDSLRKLQLLKNKLVLKEKELTPEIKKAMVMPKSDFWDKDYFEGVVSFFKTKDLSSFQASPSYGYHFTDKISVGIGPNVLVREENNKWRAYFGYRTFAKYEILSQQAYFQSEYIVDPVSVKTEYFKQTRNSILVGGGYLFPISKVIAVNICVLYRINNESYSGGNQSPWVFRLGISSIKSKNKN